MNPSEILDNACSGKFMTADSVRIHNVLVSNGITTSMRGNIPYHTNFVRDLISGIVKTKNFDLTNRIVAKVILGTDKTIAIDMSGGTLNVEVNHYGESSNICYPLRRVGPTFYETSLQAILPNYNL